MARIRSIHPKLFTDEAFVSLSMPARILIIGIWTEADDQGVFEWKPVSLKMRLFPADNVDATALLRELSAANFVRHYEMHGRQYGAIRNFRRYQKPKSPNCVHPIPPDYRNYVGLTDSVSEIPSTEPEQFPQNGEMPALMEEIIGEEEEKKDTPAVAVATRLVGRELKFQEFRGAYPKRSGANPWKPARKLFDAALKRGEDPDKIIGALRANVGFDPAKFGTEYVPQAVKWLRDERWKDWEPQAVETNHEDYQIWLDGESPEFSAWEQYRLATTGKKPPRHLNGGWRFPSQWPPDHYPGQLAAAE